MGVKKDHIIKLRYQGGLGVTLHLSDSSVEFTCIWVVLLYMYSLYVCVCVCGVLILSEWMGGGGGVA